MVKTGQSCLCSRYSVTDGVVIVSPEVIQAKRQQVLQEITARLAAEDKLRQDRSRQDAAARSNGL